MFSFFKKKQKESKVKNVKTFTFSTLEAVKIGDLYEYTVQAENKEEAFQKLVRYFFGEKSLDHKDIEQVHKHISYPLQEVFRVSGMPIWFGKRISGHTGNYHDKLVEYAKKHGIKLADKF